MFLLAMLMVSSCLSFNSKALMADMSINEEQRKLLAADGSKYEAGSSVNNHHYIPRQDFGNFNGGGGSSSSGGGSDDNIGKSEKNN